MYPQGRLSLPTSVYSAPLAGRNKLTYLFAAAGFLEVPLHSHPLARVFANCVIPILLFSITNAQDLRTSSKYDARVGKVEDMTVQ